MKHWYLMVVAMLLGASLPAAEEFRGCSWQIFDMAAAGSGRVFGIGKRHEIRQGRWVPDRELAVFDPVTERWQPRPFAVPQGMVPTAVCDLSDGAVACLWQSYNKAVLSRHLGGKDELWRSYENKYTSPRLQALANGALAITERGPHVAFASHEEGKSLVFSLEDEVLVGPADKRRLPTYAEMRVLEAGGGRLWVWSRAFRHEEQERYIDGMLEVKDGRLAKVPGLPFAPGASLSAMTLENESHILAAETGVGVWRIQLPDLKAALIEAPPDTLAAVEQLHMFNGRLHLLTRPELAPLDQKPKGGKKRLKSVSPFGTKFRIGRLWRLDGTELNLLVDNLWPDRNRLIPERLMVRGERGLLLGSMNREDHPRWVPDGKAPAYLLDVSEGFELAELQGAARLKGGGFLLRGDYGEWSVIKMPGDIPTRAVSRLRAVSSSAPLLQDSRHHVWAWQAGAANLAEWDGSRWLSHQVPAGPVHLAESEVALDAHGQAWLVPPDESGALVMELGKGTFHTFASLEQAVTETLALGDSLCFAKSPAFAPVSHPNGIKAFIDHGYTVHVLRAGRWLRSSQADMRAESGPVTSLNPLFFDSLGRINVKAGANVVQQDEDGQWMKTKDLRPPPVSLPASSAMPEGCFMSDVRFHAVDHNGADWLVTDNGEVWKWLGGKGAQLQDEGRIHLLKPPHGSPQVLVDAAGNAFIRQPDAGRSLVYAMIMARPAPVVRPAGLTSGRLIAMHPSPGVLKRWRLDEGSWSSPSREEEAGLAGLTPGAHKLEVQAFDEEWVPLGAPQVIPFNIEGMGQDDIVKQVKQLASADLAERNAAARALTSQGAFVVPALKRALEQAPEDSTLQWGIRAVLQSIEKAGR